MSARVPPRGLLDALIPAATDDGPRGTVLAHRSAGGGVLPIASPETVIGSAHEQSAASTAFSRSTACSNVMGSPVTATVAARPSSVTPLRVV